MHKNTSKTIKSSFFALGLSLLSCSVHARDSLEAIRADLNTEFTALQSQVSILQEQFNTFAPIVYSVGDIGPAGGIVFYITASGRHGLEAAPNDLLNVGKRWGCWDVNGVNGTVVGTGARNTIEILNNCRDRDSAVIYAGNYALNGFGDWYLPSKDELNLLYSQRDVVGGLLSSYYWSSSQISSIYAWSQRFSSPIIDYGIKSGDQVMTYKSEEYAIRYIRTF